MPADPLIRRLEEIGYSALDDDPYAPIRVWHLPSARQGLFSAEPMHSVALLDLLGDKPSRCLELVLEAGRAVDQAVIGGTVDEVTDHPTLQTLAGILAPTRRRNRLWRHPPHWIAIVMEAAPLPSWGQAVLDGTVSCYPRRSVVCALRDSTTGQALLPAVSDPKLQPTLDWLRGLLAPPDERLAASLDPET